MKNQKIYDDFYVLRNPLNRKIKIGRTTNFKKRERTIITQGGVTEIETLYHIKKCGDYEKYLKRIFIKYNHVGEWYHEDKHLIWLFTNTLFDYDYNDLNFEEIVIRFFILENIFSNSKEFEKILVYDDIIKITNSLFNSAKKLYQEIKKERKGLGWGVQKPFIDFVLDENIDFRNFKYEIRVINNEFVLNRLAKFDISNPKKHIKIELLKMKRNISINRIEKEELQNEIDKLYNQKDE